MLNIRAHGKSKLKINKVLGSDQQIKLAMAALDDKKALDIVPISLKGKSTMADALVIASGTSTRHAQNLAQYVVEVLEDAGVDILGVEGMDSGEWVLVDTGDIVVHVFQEEARELYRLERLWSHTFDDDNATDEEDNPALELTAT